MESDLHQFWCRIIPQLSHSPETAKAVSSYLGMLPRLRDLNRNLGEDVPKNSCCVANQHNTKVMVIAADNAARICEQVGQNI